MNVALLKKTLVAALVIATSGLAIGLVPNSIGQEAKKTNKADKTEKKAKGTLPAYYADIVTAEQRERIYTIQAKHQEKITELNDALATAKMAMTSEIEGVLTAEQKVKLKAAQEEGAAKKKKSATDKKAAEEAAKAAPAAETKAATKAVPETKTTKPK